MAFFRKAGSILGRSARNHISSPDISLSKPLIFQYVRWMSSSKVFVGGLSFSIDDSSLRDAFGRHGEVAEARVIVDRETGRSRGFGFVTFSSAEEASAAIQGMDKQELYGRQIRVAYANDRSPGYGGSGSGYNRGYGGGYGGNYNSGGGSGGAGYNSNNGYGGGSNYNSGVGSYGSGGGTTGDYDRRNFGSAGGGGGSSSAGGYDGFGDGSANSRNEGVGGGGDGFDMNEGNSFRDGDDVNSYADRRS